MKEITWYQCTDLPNFYSKNGHQSYKDEGSFALAGILLNPENQGTLLKGCNFAERGGTHDIFIMKKGGLVMPYRPEADHDHMAEVQ